MRKKPTYTKEEVDIQRTVMNHIGITPVENERGSHQDSTSAVLLRTDHIEVFQKHTKAKSCTFLKGSSQF